MYFLNRTRYVVLVISIFCLMLIFSNSIALNFTIICMDDVRIEYHQQFSSSNNTTEALPQHWLESSTHINALFSAIAIGCLIGTLPTPYIIHKIGVSGIMSLYGTLSILGTFAIPLAVRYGFVYVFIMRVLQGIGTALSFPATGLISSQWSTTKATGTYIAILSCHVQLCSIFTMPVAGELCESSLGWPAVFYLQGALSAVAFLTFCLFYKDDPGMHKNVSQPELTKITEGKTVQTKQVAPYRAIATDPCILGVWCSTIGGNLGFQIFLLYGPTYMNKVRSPGVAQIIYTLSIVFSGVNVVGTIKCGQMVARQHVHIVMSVISFLLCVVVLLIPVAVNIVCPDNTPEQWSRLFIGISVIVVVTNIPFLFVARSEPAPWTTDKVHVLPDKIEAVTIDNVKGAQNT